MESVLELVDKDEMERIKLFFSNDLRILPLGKDLKLKSRWVEGSKPCVSLFKPIAI